MMEQDLAQAKRRGTESDQEGNIRYTTHRRCSTGEPTCLNVHAKTTLSQSKNQPLLAGLRAARVKEQRGTATNKHRQATAGTKRRRRHGLRPGGVRGNAYVDNHEEDFKTR